MTDLPPVPAVDYTNKDFASLRRAMLDLAAWRVPEWTDRSPGDLGMVLVDLFAYVGDIVLYYQDRIASEAFLPTATERRSVANLLRLIGYELAPPTAATTELDLTFRPPGPGQPTTARITPGTAFTTRPDPGASPPAPALRFEYLGPDDVVVDLRATEEGEPADRRVFRGLRVTHAETRPPETLGRSTGARNQSFRLQAGPLVDSTLVVRVGDGAAATTWDRRSSLLYDVAPEDGRLRPSGPKDRHYTVERDEQGGAAVVFGDGEFGAIPDGGETIRATYAVGGGTVGNVAPGTIVAAVSGTSAPPSALLAVTNPRAAVGGTDAEALDHARRFGPLAFRSGDRAVTLRDYTALAHQAGGVAKVRARAAGGNRVELVVVPVGDEVAEVSSEQHDRLLTFFEDRKMLGTAVTVLSASPVRVDVRVEVLAEHHHDPEAIRRRAEAEVRGLLAIDRVDLGRPVYLSKVYEAVEAIDGVAAAVVTRFRRDGEQVAEIPAEGRIAVGDVEIAVPGTIEVSSRTDVP